MRHLTAASFTLTVHMLIFNVLFSACPTRSSRALEQRYVDQIRELQSDLYVEKEQFLSLRTDFEQRRRAEWADQEERMKNEWNTIKGVRETSKFSPSHH